MATTIDVILENTSVTLEMQPTSKKWYTQRDMAFLNGITVFVGTIGFVGNLMVLVVLINFKKLRNRGYSLLLGNQAAADLGCSIFLITMHALRLKETPPEDEALATFLCYFLYASTLVRPCIYASALNLVWFTVERYLSIVQPKIHKTVVSKATIIAGISISWIIPCCLTLPLSIVSSGLKNGICIIWRFWPNIHVKNLKTVSDILLYGAVTVFVTTYCYIHMLVKLQLHMRRREQQRNAARLGQQVTTRALGDERLTRAQINLAQTFFIMLAFFLACWFPQQLFFVLFNVGAIKWETVDLANLYLNALVYLNCCINPCIYAAKYTEFRQGLRSLLGLYPTKVEDASVDQSNLSVAPAVRTHQEGQGTTQTSGVTQ